jgi:hypothetical protein
VRRLKSLSPQPLRPRSRSPVSPPTCRSSTVTGIPSGGGHGRAWRTSTRSSRFSNFEFDDAGSDFRLKLRKTGSNRDISKQTGPCLHLIANIMHRRASAGAGAGATGRLKRFACIFVHLPIGSRQVGFPETDRREIRLAASFRYRRFHEPLSETPPFTIPDHFSEMATSHSCRIGGGPRAEYRARSLHPASRMYVCVLGLERRRIA